MLQLTEIIFEHYQKCEDAFCPMNQKCFSLTTPCQCIDGFGLNVAGDCKDNDECMTDSENCSNNSTCVNTEGSYRCQENITFPVTSTSEPIASSTVTISTQTTSIMTTTVPTTTALTTEPITTPESLRNWVFVMSDDFGVKPPMLLNGYGDYKGGVFTTTL